jgi:hypothetical protein
VIEGLQGLMIYEVLRWMVCEFKQQYDCFEKLRLTLPSFVERTKQRHSEQSSTMMRSQSAVFSLNPLLEGYRKKFRLDEVESETGRLDNVSLVMQKCLRKDLEVTSELIAQTKRVR